MFVIEVIFSYNKIADRINELDVPHLNNISIEKMVKFYLIYSIYLTVM